MVVSSCPLIQEEVLGVGAWGKHPWRELGTEEITELRRWGRVWFVIGKGHEAGEGTRFVGTVVSLPGPVWVTVKHRNHRQPDPLLPSSLAGSPAQSSPKLLGTRLSRVNSLSVPPGRGVRTPAMLRRRGGARCLPVTSPGEPHPVHVCVCMHTQEAVSLLGCVHLWVTGALPPPVSGGPGGRHHAPGSEASVILASVLAW